MGNKNWNGISSFLPTEWTQSIMVALSLWGICSTKQDFCQSLKLVCLLNRKLRWYLIILVRIFKCERVPDSTIDRLINTISDRCRIPSCFGGGAVQLRPDVVTPVLIVPTCLCLATLHPVMTVMVFLFMPLFVLTFHAFWRRQKKNRRTCFFYYWGITSVISCYCVFQVSW